MASFPAWINEECFDIEKIPPDNSQFKIHLFADFMELAAVASSVNTIPLGEIENLQDDDDNMANSPPMEEGIADIDADRDEDFEHYDSEAGESDILGIGAGYDEELEKELTDKTGSRKNKIPTAVHSNLMKAVFENRKQRLNGKWPFQMKVFQKAGGLLSLELEFIPSHAWADRYLTLLLCASQQFFNKSGSSIYTSYFEEIGFYVLKQLFTNPWQIKKCGAAASGIHAYTGTVKEKITALCHDMGMGDDGLNPYWQPAQSGDGGIDLVAFLPFADGYGYISAAFGQCACTNQLSQIENKALESSHAKLRAKINFQALPLNLLFSPVELSEPTRKTKFILSGCDAAIIDRSRLLEHMDNFTLSPEIISHNQQFCSIGIDSLQSI